MGQIPRELWSVYKKILWIIGNIWCDTIHGEQWITLCRIHNLLALGAQYQMEPGSNRSTEESRSPQGRAGLQGGGGSYNTEQDG